MRGNTHIEWTEATWNPVSGCTKVSAGCKNCYAERMARRLQAMGSPRYSNGFEVTLHHDLVDAPKLWRTPKLIFVNSMSDLFHDSVPLAFIQKVFSTMNDCSRHTFQILTKRSARLAELSRQLTWGPNIWIGVSVEDARVTSRIDELRQVPAAVRFISFEPLIGRVGALNLTGIDWAIVGGESGPHARPMSELWVAEIFDACRQSDTAFFFKQWGGVRKDLTGRVLNGRTYDEMPVPKNHQTRQTALALATC